jgi:hypothetical protein
MKTLVAAAVAQARAPLPVAGRGLDAFPHDVNRWTSFAADPRDQHRRRSARPRGEADKPMSGDAPALAVVEVECYAGYRGEETPRRFRLAEQELEIADVVDRWLTPDHRYFKVQDMQGGLYIVRHDVTGDRWELTWFRRRADGRTSPPTRRSPDDPR